MNERNGIRDDNAGRSLQRLSDRDMAMILRRMASDAVSHANGLGSIARMLERNHGASQPVRLDEIAQGIVARCRGETDDEG